MQVYPLRDSIHPSAMLFIDQCDNLGIQLNSQEIEAINFLVTKLIQTNLWNKIRVLYPFVGRSPKTHSLNLRNIFRHKINWFNGPISHDSLGVTNTGDGYGNTYFAPSWLSDTDIHVAVYTGTFWVNANENCPLIGSSPAYISQPPQRGNSWMHAIYLRSPIPSTSLYIGPAAIYTYSCGDVTSLGSMFAGEIAYDRIHSTALGLIVGVNGKTCFVCGQKYGIDTSTATSFPQPINPQSGNDPIEGKKTLYSQFPFLLFTNGRFGHVTGQARANLRLVSVGYAMNESENRIFYSIIEDFQKILQRNVGCYEIKPKEAEIIERENPHPNVKITNVRRNIGRYINYLGDTIALRPQNNIGDLYRKEVSSTSITMQSCIRTGPIRVFAGDGAMPNVSILSFQEN